MSERVERIAKALYREVESGVPGVAWDTDDDKLRDHYRHMARIAEAAFWADDEIELKRSLDEAIAEKRSRRQEHHFAEALRAVIR